MPNPHSKILSNTVPLIFQWLPQEFGATVPNNKDLPYLQRLVDWAAREPQREIYLVVNGAGLEPQQMTDLRTQLAPVKNIHVVDFNEIPLDKDIILPVGKDVLQPVEDGVTPPSDKEIITLHSYGSNETQRININRGIKLSELSKGMYSKDNTDSELNYVRSRIPFAVALDGYRLLIMQNVKKIVGSKEAIYMDFDVLPDKTGAQIGEVKILKDILMSDALGNSPYAKGRKGG